MPTTPTHPQHARRVLGLRKGQSVCVLVADDVGENRELLRYILTDLGCEVLLAENGTTAIGLLRIHRPELAFLDIRMPELGGQEVARLAREDPRLCSVKLVAVSASVLTHEQQAYLDAGFDAFLPKPFQLEEVCACMEGLLHVTFDYEPTAMSSPEARAAVTPDGLVLPAALLRPLVEAARRHSATQLERSLAALERRGDLERCAAEHLRHLTLQGDFEAAHAFLNRIPSTTQDAEP